MIYIRSAVVSDTQTEEFEDIVTENEQHSSPIESNASQSTQEPTSTATNATQSNITR